MKTRIIRPWAKALAAVLCIASLTAALTALFPVSELAGAGGFQPDGYEGMLHRREQLLVEERVLELHCLLSDTGANIDLEATLEAEFTDPNFLYEVKDESGQILAAHKNQGPYRARYSETIERYRPNSAVITETEVYPTPEALDAEIAAILAAHPYAAIEQETLDTGGIRLTYSYPAEDPETITITGFLRQDLVNSGAIYQELTRLEFLYAHQTLLLVLLAGGLCLGLLTLAFLCRAAGHKADREGITLLWWDRVIPPEFTLFLLLGAAVLSLAPLRNIVWNLWTLPLLAARTGFIALCLTAAVATLLSLVRQGKGRTLWQTSLLWKLGRGLTALGREFSLSLTRLLDRLPLFWAVALGFLLLCVLEFLAILIMVQFWNPIPGAILWLLLKLAACAILIWAVLAMRTLQHGGEELAAGNLDYRVPLDRLRGAFRAHGQDLNSIRSAIHTAVEDQMKSERMKTELITNVSHDIKTPLTSIVSYVDLLKKQEMPTPEAREYLDVLDRQAGKLKKLTEDLVEAAKASSGNLPVDPQPTDVNVLLSQSAGEYQERLLSRDLQLVLTPHPENPVISADGRLLWRVFENLLGNICKYAQPGTRVYLTCGADGAQVALTFRNISATPLNISPEELMERFVRGDDARHTDGNGLGLSIARSLTQLQKGNFRVDIDGDLFKATLTFPRLV